MIITTTTTTTVLQYATNPRRFNARSPVGRKVLILNGAISFVLCIYKYIVIIIIIIVLGGYRRKGNT